MIVIIVTGILEVTTMVTGVTAVSGIMDMIRVAIIIEEVIATATVTVRIDNIFLTGI